MVPPAVTIGRNQRWARVIDTEACAARGWDWVRRPTGGGALLHQHEINYAVAAGGDVFAGDGVVGFRAIFTRIIMALAVGVEALGLKPTVCVGRSAAAPDQIEQHGLCGRSLTQHEIALNGGKLVAAAQLLKPGAILQHGTLYQRAPCSQDRFWPMDPNDLHADALAQRWIDLGQSLRTLSWTEVADRLRRGLVGFLGIRCQTWEPSELDWGSIRQQVADWKTEGWRSRR
jgi:lipoate-protein ligase A